MMSHFFAAVEYFGAVYHFPNVIARYFVGDPKSLSGRKLLSAIGSGTSSESTAAA